MTDAALDIASEHLLAPAGLETNALGRVLDGLLGHAVDAADLYFQSARQESWILEDGIVREGSFDVDRGVGVRAMAGERTGFAYSDEIALPALEQSARAARAIARAGQDAAVPAWRGGGALALYPSDDPLATLTDSEKVELLMACDREARAADPAVKQVIASLSGKHEVVLVAASDGTLAADVRPLVRLNVSVIVERDGRREQGMGGGGGRHGYDVFVQQGRAREYAREAVRQALVNTEAVDAPAGTMPVVLGSGWAGVLLHEAVGHGLEGDFNRKGTSAFAGRVGERVAARGCTVVDEGSIDGRRGSLSIDDEGTATQCTTLIEDGILTGYMQDKMNARLMGQRSTGNGRRESYAHLPMPRMTNTYMRAGDRDPQEIIESVDRGLYAVNFGGGQVDITSGKFVFSVSEAYMIENGRVTKPVKGATLIGNGPSALHQVSMVGNDLELDTGIGVCGKEGQSVPVGVGQPTLKLDAITVGGTQSG
ncbi:metalloprotease TldD [Halofilum ochraceum]|uniref:metalloprotease TldD n=1 Tax=Halofilum ochraceum TaxID=1611323 RepID=UPI00082AAAE1|nr:metalloprotease TldD [Halofilum ochraceum]